MTDRFEARIEKIVAGGDGLARHEGRVVFVPGTAVGEEHLVEVVTARKDFLRGRSIERRDASPDRRTAPCPFYERCGGCSLMHLEPSAQLRAKREILRESLERAGCEVEDAGAVETVAAEELGYRSRLRFHVANQAGKPVVGFRRRGSRDIVDIDACLLGSAGVNEALQRLRRFVHKRPLVAKFLVDAELMESSESPGRVIGRFYVRSIDGLRFFDPDRQNEILDLCGLAGLVVGTVGGGPQVRIGETSIRHRVGEIVLVQSAESFFQTNRFLVEALVSAVVPRESPERVLDLYSGVGLFTLPLARDATSVLGVEGSASAVRDARANADTARVGNVRFRRADVTSYLEKATLREGDLIVADPPRGGLTRASVAAIGRSPVRSFRYVSCDPPAFARDAVLLRAQGFRLVSLRLLDLFPNTHLFETVAHLSR